MNLALYTSDHNDDRIVQILTEVSFRNFITNFCNGRKVPVAREEYRDLFGLEYDCA